MTFVDSPNARNDLSPLFLNCESLPVESLRFNYESFKAEFSIFFSSFTCTFIHELSVAPASFSLARRGVVLALPSLNQSFLLVACLIFYSR